MKKRLFSLAMALAVCLSLIPVALAASAQERGVLTYTEMIAPKYEKAFEFCEGLAAVKQNGKWGYIDTSGKTVIPFEYDIAFNFNERLAVVGELVDITGRTDLRDGLYCKIGFVDKNNKYTPFLLDSVQRPKYKYEDGHIIDFEGWERISCNRDVIAYFEPIEDDMDGWESVFHNGHICLYCVDFDAANDGWNGYNLFDTSGKTVDFPLGYEINGYPTSPINEGIAILRRSETSDCAYYDLNTKKMFTNKDMDYAQVGTSFNQGLSLVCTTDYRYDSSQGRTYEICTIGFIDKTGSWIIPPTLPCSNWMVMGLETEYVIFGDTGAAILKNADSNLWGAIDKAGKTVIPFEYDQLWPYSFGLSAFEKDGKWGYLDEQGKVAIPAQFSIAGFFSEDGYAVVSKGNEAYLIDYNGNRIPGTDKISMENYFVRTQAENDSPATTEVELGDSSVAYGIFTQDETGNSLRMIVPSEYLIIQKNGKFGYAHVEYLPTLPEVGDMDEWAYEEVTAAIKENLVPNNLQNLYLNDINRGEFCELVMQALETITGEDMDALVTEKAGITLDKAVSGYPFKDASDRTVVAASALGIVNGKGNQTFDPYAAISRQEAATMLMRAASVLGANTTTVTSADFADSSNIAVWAKDAVNFVYQVNVMNGIGNNLFDPLSAYTREQSYMTVYRLLLAVTGRDASEV